jgi:hypothetical protein
VTEKRWFPAKSLIPIQYSNNINPIKIQHPSKFERLPINKGLNLQRIRGQSRTDGHLGMQGNRFWLTDKNNN